MKEVMFLVLNSFFLAVILLVLLLFSIGNHHHETLNGDLEKIKRQIETPAP